MNNLHLAVSRECAWWRADMLKPRQPDIGFPLGYPFVEGRAVDQPGGETRWATLSINLTEEPSC